MLAAAVHEYLDRQSGACKPEGKNDKAGRWYPSAAEWCPCCDDIRAPSRLWPSSLYVHCRSMKHIAELYGVDVTELRRAVRKAREE